MIDFEPHVTAAVVNLPPPDGCASTRLARLLYVDRRGAPENRQLGFDTVDKVPLLTAIAETRAARRPPPAVDHRGQLAAARRAALARRPRASRWTRRRRPTTWCATTSLALGTGYVERVFWWQLVAQGYGLVDAAPGGTLRRRPAFRALATLERELAGATCHGPQPAGEGVRLYRFTGGHAGTGETWVGWSLAGAARARLPRSPASAVDRDGGALAAPDAEVELTASPRYFRLSAS